MMRTSKDLSKHAEHLLAQIKAGNNRLFAADGRPAGWLQLERLGIARREGDRAILIDSRLPCEKRAEERSSEERVIVIHARANAADSVLEVARSVLGRFVDELDRKFVLDAIEMRLAELRREVGAS